MNGEPVISDAEFSAGARAEAKIVVDGNDGDTESLWDWLRDEPELRGRLRMRGASIPDETMGAPIELVAVLATTTAVASALARSVSTWLVQHRSDLTVTMTGPDGRRVSVSSQRVADPEGLLRAVLDPASPDSVNGPAPHEVGKEPDTTGER